MRDLANITSSLNIVVASNGDWPFYNIMRDALNLASSAEIRLEATRFLDNDESLYAYIGIITVADDLTIKFDTENIASSMEGLMPMLAGERESPLNVEKVLLCKFSNVLLIETFSILHGLDVASMLSPESAVSFWGTAPHNRRHQMGRNGLRSLLQN